jgi:ParB family chromosome partitioning protein
MTTSAAPSAERELPLDAIDPPAEAHRAHLDIGELGRLADDMAARGLLQAIAVRANAYGDRYEVIYGHRRFEAARLLRWATLRARVYAHDADIEEARMAENAFRADLNPLEEAHVCARWLARGHARAHVARIMRRSEEWVAGRLAVLEFPDDLRAAVAAGTMTLAVARALAPVDFGPYRAQLIAEATRAGASARVVDAWAAHYAADRERIVTNTVTIEELAQQRDTYIVKIVCECCLDQVPLDERRQLSVCTGCYRDLLDAIKTGRASGA